MAKTHYYTIENPSSLEDLKNQMNMILRRLSDRLDKIEGIRGSSTVQESLSIEVDSLTLHGFNTEDEV